MNKKVLIVEDEVAIADLEKDYLELSGFDVVIENAGDTGLKRALSDEFDIIVLDLMLPGMDGFEVCKQIREKKDVPIYLTATLALQDGMSGTAVVDMKGNLVGIADAKNLNTNKSYALMIDNVLSFDYSKLD